MTIPDARLIEAVYVLADQMHAISRHLEGAHGRNGLWRDLPADCADKLEAIIGGFDFLMRSKSVCALADAWQVEIDAAVSQ